MLAEFHSHSQYSDGKLSIRELIDFFGRLGYGCLAITDHLCEEKTLLGKIAAYVNHTLTRESFSRYIDEIKSEAERARKLYDMVVLPGFEITKNSLKNHRSAHMLAIGVEEYISADLDVLSISKRVRDLGGIFVAAHPISLGRVRNGNYYLWDQRDKYREAFDAWEITDGGQLLDEVVKSDLPKLANSDFHRESNIQSWKTLIKKERHPDAILDAVRKQKLEFIPPKDAKSSAA